MAFESFGIASPAIVGTAPTIFVASTADSLAEITTAGYLDAFLSQGEFKENDVFWINYDDLSTFPLYPSGMSATLGSFSVSITAGVSTLVALPDPALGTAAGKDASDNLLPTVASVNGATVANNFASFNDTAGTVEDSGFNVDNVLRYASVPITAAQFNGMYAAPMLLIAAPGANRLIVVDRMELVMTFVAAAYAAGGVVAAQWDSTANGLGQHATNIEAAADFFAAASSVFMFNGNSGNAATTDGGLVPFVANVNKGLYLSNKTGAFTTGDGTWVAKIHYRIIATA